MTTVVGDGFAPTSHITTFTERWLGHSSHVVDLGDGSVLVIDPARIPTRESDFARDRGLTVAYTADTHTHADYISGSPDLAADGAVFLAPAQAELKLQYEGVSDDDVVGLGRLRLEVIATPGHTPDHLAYLISEGDHPIGLFSGGSLMVGTVGRTDLLGDDLREGLARQLYQALRDRIMVLPDDLPVYPTHGQGSFCSAPGGSAVTTTIGQERATNPLLAAATEDQFVEQLLAGFGPFPPYFRRLPTLNQTGLPHFSAVPALPALTPQETALIVDAGGIVVDARPAADFARGHIPGSVSITLRAVFASWFGWLIPPDAAVVFVTDDDQDEAALVRYCLTVGHDQLAGRLTSGVEAWAAAGHALTRTPLLDLDAAPADRPLIDVRAADEFRSGHIPGALNYPLPGLPDDAVPAAPVVMCGAIERAMTGASVLRRRGQSDVAVLSGGYGGWSRRAATASP